MFKVYHCFVIAFSCVTLMNFDSCQGPKPQRGARRTQKVLRSTVIEKNQIDLFVFVCDSACFVRY